MADKIRIQMMGNFAIYINEIRVDQMLDKSRKGVALMQVLLMHRGEPVPNQRLMMLLWHEEKSTNPENALKTLVSRMRALLNQIVPGLGKCIVSERGAYYWENLPDMAVDLFEMEDIFSELSGKAYDDAGNRMLYDRLIKLYMGDLALQGEQNDWVISRATSLRNRYMSAVYNYIKLLKQKEDYATIVMVCRSALNVDTFDDRLHMELMSALIKLERSNEAMHQYKYVMQLYHQYLGVHPSDDMQEFYKQIVNSEKTLEFSLESIRNELLESNEKRGAFVCEYVVFKEIFNLQMYNLERLGSTMFLGVIMVSEANGKTMEPLKQDGIIQDLLEILRLNLRKGDTVTRVSPTIVATLMPTVNYGTGSMVLERIKEIFYQKYPNSDVCFVYRIVPLSSDAENSVGDLRSKMNDLKQNVK